MASRSRHIGTGIVAGSIGGIAGGIAMIPFFILSALVSSMPSMMVFTYIGFAFGAEDANSAITLGFVMHLAASVLIGILFGMVTGAFNRLRIMSYRQGIGLGLIAGMVAFVALYIPMTVPSASQSTQLGISIEIGIVEHLVYGAVLGAFTAVLVLNAEKRRRRAGGIFECSTCHARFTSAQDLDEHMGVAHHGVAA